MLTDGTKTQSHRAWQNELGKSFPPDRPEQVGLTKYIPPAIPELTPEQELIQWRESIEVSAAQAKIALKRAKYFGQVKQIINQLPEDDELVIAWENAYRWRRISPTLNALGNQLSLTELQKDDLFKLADSIEI